MARASVKSGIGLALSLLFLGLALRNVEWAGVGASWRAARVDLLLLGTVLLVGNVEGKELFGGQADVVVTDGFTGNILLKSSESVSKLLTEVLKEEMTASLIRKIGALLVKPAFGRVKEMMDPREVGAAPLLGIDGLVFVGHGRSDAHALVSALKVARQAVNANLLAALGTAIQDRLALLEAANPSAEENA